MIWRVLMRYEISAFKQTDGWPATLQAVYYRMLAGKLAHSNKQTADPQLCKQSIIECLRVSHLFVLTRKFVPVRCSRCERLTELCALSACEHLSSVIKTILTKYEWSAIYRKKSIHIFYCILNSHSLQNNLQSEFKIIFCLFSNTQSTIEVPFWLLITMACALDRSKNELQQENVIWVKIFIKYS